MVIGRFGGCRPGEPIADLVFVVMFGKVLKEVRSVLAETEYDWTCCYDENQFVEARARRHTAQETYEAAVRSTTVEFCQAAKSLFSLSLFLPFSLSLFSLLSFLSSLLSSFLSLLSSLFSLLLLSVETKRREEK